ncbi:hypothetical protein F4861DRAFT_138651 [Xylaria intraflava]|nr:hypothetical protein F4861DRAFT_138651 [Xylaria intraflava]
MNMAKDTTVRSSSSSHKRHTSLSGWFSKILPSHRPEQGGTTRPQDTSDGTSAYLNSGINPNDLTEWNLAREQPPRLDAPKAAAENPNLRARGMSMQHGRRGLGLDDGARVQSARSPIQTASLDLARPQHRPSPNPPPRPQHQRKQSITGREVSTLLRAKEDTRRLRRGLKESGDWLGVQGADPYSGEFAVLTPTSTISTDSTSPSSKERLAELARRQETAKLTYSRAKLEVARARERGLLKKERLRLEKMEQAKDERRRQQHQFPTWTQHEERWLSAAEPDLSPIPQSRKSSKGDEAVTITAGNFLRRVISGGNTGQPKPIETPGQSANTGLPKPDPRANRSTDTIVRKALPSTALVNTTMKGMRDAHTPVLADADDTPHQEQNSEKNFLWRCRRRVTDPGKLIRRRPSLGIHPSAARAGQSLISVSIEQPPHLQRCQESRDHFPDLLIPDHRLHLVPYPEQVERPERTVIPMKCDPSSVLWTMPIESEKSDILIKPALRVMTNHSDSQELQTGSQKAAPGAKGAKEATAISSPSKLKRGTKPPIHQRTIPTRSSSFRARQVLILPQTQNTSQIRGRADTGLSENILLPQDVPQPLIPPEITEVKPTEVPRGQTDGNLNGPPERGLEESVSTPTITIIGFEPTHPLLHVPDQLCIEARKDGEINARSNDAAPLMPGLQGGERAPCDTSTAEHQGVMTDSSRPIMLPSDSESFVLSRKTREIDMPSADLAIRGTDPMPPARHLQAQVSHQDLHNAVMKRAREELEGVGVTMHSPPQQEVKEIQNIRPKEFYVDRAGSSHPRGNETQAAHQHLTPREREETMIHEVARIAIRKSRAKEIATRKARMPSPRTGDYRETLPVVPPDHDTTIRPESSPGGDGVNAECTFIRSGSMDLRVPSLLELQVMSRKGSRRVKRCDGKEHPHEKDGGENGTGEDYDGDPPGAVVTLVSLLITAYMVVFSLSRAWWVMLQRASDQGVEPWRRRLVRKSTWGDIGVILAACGFCVAVALLFVGGIETGWRV